MQTIEKLEARVATLEAENALLRNKKNSNNSHIPPSQDQNRLKKNQSLRLPTGRRPGGQPAHEGTTLECHATVDETISDAPARCGGCGCDLDHHPGQLSGSRQLLDIPAIALKCIEHQIYKKQCGCGHVTVGEFPAHVAAPVQYGPNVEALIAYLHARQYLPYARTREFLANVMGLSISTGGIHNILQRIAQKALPIYDAKKEKIGTATCVGTDETGVNINGKNHWAWTWQNDTLTYIVCAASRGFKTIEAALGNGLPNAALIHDRWPCHFQMDAKAHQICTAHLLRELNYINEIHKNKCIWATAFKALLLDAIHFKKGMATTDYYYPNTKRQALFDRLDHGCPITWTNATKNQQHCKRNYWRGGTASYTSCYNPMCLQTTTVSKGPLGTSR